MTNLIDGADRVSRIFGGWPSFHDAEVIRVVLDRSGPEAPTLELQIHVFRMTGEVGPEGHYVLKDHTLVTLRFTAVAEVEITGFNEQNALGALELSALDPEQHEGRRVAVKMPSSYGMTAVFECARGEVTDARPHEPSA